MSLTDEQKHKICSTIHCIIDRWMDFIVREEQDYSTSYEKITNSIKEIFFNAKNDSSIIVLPNCMITQLSFLPSQQEKSIGLMKNILRGIFVADIKTLKRIMVLRGSQDISSASIVNEVRKEAVRSIIKYFNGYKNAHSSTLMIAGDLEFKPLTAECIQKIAMLKNVYLGEEDGQNPRSSSANLSSSIS